MNDILNEFYRGRLFPAKRRAIEDSGMSRAMEELSEAEDLLDRTLPPELNAVLKRLVAVQGTVDAITAEASHIDGFRTGARFMLAILDDGAARTRSRSERSRNEL